MDETSDPTVHTQPGSRVRTPRLDSRLRRARFPRRRGGREEPSGGREIGFLECCPELAAAIRHGRPEFAQVAKAYYLTRDGTSASAEERELLRTEFPGLLEAFEREHGRIARSYFAEDVTATAALTANDELTVMLGRELPAGSEDVVDLLQRADEMAYAAWHRLAQFDRRLCQNMIFSVVEEALRRLDAGTAKKSTVERLNGRLQEAEQFMLRCAARRAQSRYLKGMLWGAAATGVLVGAAAAVLAAGGDLTRLAGQLLLVATAGAVGAVVSVLWRMTSGSFRLNLPTLNAEMKDTDLRLIAGLRPVIGAVFAIALYVLIASALVPLEKGNGAEETALFAAVGFLAGFSERFAQDMFIRSGEGVTGVMGDSPTSGPSAGLAPPPGAKPAA